MLRTNPVELMNSVFRRTNQYSLVCVKPRRAIFCLSPDIDLLRENHNLVSEGLSLCSYSFSLLCFLLTSLLRRTQNVAFLDIYVNNGPEIIAASYAATQNDNFIPFLWRQKRCRYTHKLSGITNHLSLGARFLRVAALL